jgi:hypothetical protein
MRYLTTGIRPAGVEASRRHPITARAGRYWIMLMMLNIGM